MAGKLGAFARVAFAIPLLLASACSSNDTPTESSANTTTTSTGTGPTACTYPAPPYGTEVGEVLADSYVWEGFAAHANAASMVAIADYEDCDGSGDIDALLLVTIVAACSECQQHLDDLETRMATWEAAGIRIVVLVGDSAQGPATVSDAQAWKSALGLDALAVVADPNFSLVLDSESGWPSQVVVDPRTMQVMHRRVGFDDDYSALEGLAADNAEP
jgi:hypothetical protein